MGSPIYINWHWPPSHKDASTNNINVVDPSVGVSDKADVWRVIVATENRVKTAQQIANITPRIDQVRDPGSFSATPNNVELAWHYTWAVWIAVLFIMVCMMMKAGDRSSRKTTRSG